MPVQPPAKSHKETIIAVAIALALTGFLLFGILSIGNKATESSMHGVITEKTFLPAPETQITIGKGGLHSRDVAGQYVLHVYVPANNRSYFVYVDPRDYEGRKVGDKYFFVKPPPEPEPSETPEPASNATGK